MQATAQRRDFFAITNDAIDKVIRGGKSEDYDQGGINEEAPEGECAIFSAIAALTELSENPEWHNDVSSADITKMEELIGEIKDKLKHI